MGDNYLRLLPRFWERLNMVARAAGYYGVPFCGEKGVTQGDPLLPTKNNVVVDGVVHHWEYLLVVEREGGITAVTKETGHRRRGG